MIKERLTAIKEELFSFSIKDKIFILSAMLCGFCITAEYAIVRPISNSVFIHAYGSKMFPWAWVAVVPLNLFVVYLYNRYLKKFGCLNMFLAIISIIAFGSLISALFLKQWSPLSFLLYIWKEVYVMLMFQQLWSMIHCVIRMNQAKYLYGLFFAVGGIGGILGSIVPGFFAVKMGSEHLLFLCLPIYGLLAFFYFLMIKNSSVAHEIKEGRFLEHQNQAPSFADGFKLISNSRFLTFILLLVVFMQFSSTIIDFQFNSTLETEIPDKDLRTEFSGRILGIVNLTTTALQCFGSFLLIHFLGLRRSHLLIPLVLCLNACSYLLFPFFGVIVYSYISIKSFDFSLFGVIKEMLYIPLKLDEKFRAKAVIDVFVYRSCKALAGLIILSFQWSQSAALLPMLTLGNVAIFLFWGFIVLKLFKEYSPAPQA